MKYTRNEAVEALIKMSLGMFEVFLTEKGQSSLNDALTHNTDTARPVIVVNKWDKIEKDNFTRAC